MIHQISGEKVMAIIDAVEAEQWYRLAKKIDESTPVSVQDRSI